MINNIVRSFGADLIASPLISERGLTLPRQNQAPVAANPVAVTDNTFTDEDQAVTFHVLANDTDADGDKLTVSFVQNPSNGTAIINSNNTITYIPDAGYFGTDVFYYVARDPSGGSGYGNIFVTVYEVTTPPALPGTEFLSYDFSFGSEGMSFVDGAFRGSTELNYSSGSLNNGAIQVVLGGGDNTVIDDMSGSWRVDFFLTEARGVIVEFDYDATMAGSFESNEKLEILTALDFNLVGLATADTIATFAGLDQADDFTTGTVSVQLDLGDVDAGHHVLDIGAFLNRKNQTNETATVRLDDFAIYTNSPIGAGNVVEPTPNAMTPRLTTGGDVFKLYATDDSIDGDFGDDDINGMGGNDMLFGSSGNDVLKGASGNDELVGGVGADLLIGGSGADIFWGGSGLDTYVGDQGATADADRFCFTSADLDAVDRIRDFDIDEGDILDLSNLVTGFVDGTSDVAEFVKFIDIGTKTVVKVDIDGGGDEWHKLLFLNGVTGQTDVAQLYLNGTIDLI